MFFSGLAVAQSIDTPKTKAIPFSQLGPAGQLALVMTVPDNYVWVKKFVEQAGVVVLCADSDETALSESGDFSRTKNSVITLRQSASDYYDTSKKAFSFEKSIDSELKSMGAKNYTIQKREVKGLPVVAVTFEVGERKLYSLAIAQGSVVYRLSYNARSPSRAYDDAAWGMLVDGL